MANSPTFGMRLMATNDLQKEVIFNEAAVLLEALTARTVVNRQNGTPSTPANGQIWIVGPAGTGVFSGKNNQIGFYFNGWRFIVPTEKMKMYNQTTSTFWTYSAGGWTQDAAGTPSTLNDLTDVSGTPTDGQALIFDADDSTWKPTDLPSQSNLSDLPDVDTSTPPTGGQVLVWNAVDNKWVPGTISGGGGASQLADLTDVDMSGGEPGDGELLTWDADSDKAVFKPYAFPAASLNDFTDVNTAGAVPNDALIWNGSIWAPSSVALNFSFENMLDGPGTLEGYANHFLVVDPTESFLTYKSLQSLIDDLDDFAMADLTDVTAPSDSHVGKAVVLTKVGSDFIYNYQTLTNYSIPFYDGVTQLTTRILSMRFEGFDIDEPTEGNIVITAQNALGFEVNGVPVVGTINAINFTGDFEAVLDGTTLDITVNIPDPVLTIADLQDVDVTTDPPVDGEVLKWDQTQGKWVPGVGGGGGGIPIDGEAAPATYELGPFAPPNAGMFPSNLNAPSADLTFVPNRGLMVQPGPQSSGVRHGVVWRTLANNEEPWIITARVVPNSLQVTGHAVGIALLRAFNNSFAFLAYGNSEQDSGIIRFGWVSGAGAETILTSEPNTEYNWLRMAFDGNFIRAWVSTDGILWQNFGSPHDPSASLGGTPNRVGITNRTNETTDGNCGGLFTYWDDPDYPAAARTQMGIVALNMGGLQDVDLETTPPADGETLIWDAAAEKWVPGEGGGGGIGEVIGLDPDSDINYLLEYDNDEDVWKAIPSPFTVQAGDPTPYGTHAYWRVRPSGGMHANYVVCSKLIFRSIPGGAEISTVGGTPIESGHYASNAAALAFDSDNTTSWESQSGIVSLGQVWLGMQFATPVSVTEIEWECGLYEDDERPFNGEVQYSDDGSTWTTAFLFGLWDWTSGMVMSNTSTSNHYQPPYGGLALAALGDVDMGVEPEDGQSLIFDEASGKWKPGAGVPETLGDIGDVDLTVPPEDGQALIWDDTAGKWVAGAGVPEELGDIGDVDLTIAPVNGNSLVFDGGDGKWKAGVGLGNVAADFDLSFFIPGTPDADVLASFYLTARDFTLETDLEDSFAYCTTAPGSGVSFPLKKNGVDIGSLEFAFGVNVGTFVFGSNVDFVPGDRLEIWSPSALGGIEDIAITIAGTRA